MCSWFPAVGNNQSKWTQRPICQSFVSVNSNYTHRWCNCVLNVVSCRVFCWVLGIFFACKQSFVIIKSQVYDVPARTRIRCFRELSVYHQVWNFEHGLGYIEALWGNRHSAWASCDAKDLCCIVCNAIWKMEPNSVHAVVCEPSLNLFYLNISSWNEVLCEHFLER